MKMLSEERHQRKQTDYCEARSSYLRTHSSSSYDRHGYMTVLDHKTKDHHSDLDHQHGDKIELLYEQHRQHIRGYLALAVPTIVQAKNDVATCIHCDHTIGHVTREWFIIHCSTNPWYSCSLTLRNTLTKHCLCCYRSCCQGQQSRCLSSWDLPKTFITL